VSSSLSSAVVFDLDSQLDVLIGADPKATIFVGERR